MIRRVKAERDKLALYAWNTPRWRLGLGFAGRLVVMTIVLREVVALVIFYVVDGCFDAWFVPEIARAAMVSPNSRIG